MAEWPSSVVVHPTALVHPDARIGEGTRIGAFSTVGPKVVIGARCEIQEHVVIRDYTSLGDDVKVFPFAVLGAEPQHLKYAGEPTTAVIGNRVILRESVTINRGTAFGNGTTIVGDDCMLMAYCHVAHDCVVGKGVIMANGVQLAGHVEIGNYVTLGGLSAVTQFNRVGSYAYIGGGSLLRKDLPPYLTGKGNEFEVQGINSVGLERRGFSADAILKLRKTFRVFYKKNLTGAQALESAVTEFGGVPEVQAFLTFVETSKTGIVRG